MTRLLQHGRPRRTTAAVACAIAALAVVALVGMAAARALTLGVSKGAKVTNQSGSTETEDIVVNASGRAVYTLSGDTTKHPKCTKASGCFSFWPPVTVKSAKGLTKGAGVKGRLGTFKRNGIIQVTLGGRPLYTFVRDHRRNHATGEGVNGFGGIWHVVKDARSGGQGTGSPQATSTSTTTSPYPGY